MATNSHALSWLACIQREGEYLKLTCLDIPKSASLTTPDASTSKLAPLISLNRTGKEHMKLPIIHARILK